jgi:peptidoglycan/xylan/chitin deacetylase (PgdA/CDA1 family)
MSRLRSTQRSLFTRTLVAAAALLFASASTGSAQQDCPETCLPPQCFCASASPPGDLAPIDVPQFVLLTYDDAVQPAGFALMSATLEGLNPNGCPRAATFFVNTDYNDYWLTQRLYAAGHEIADHTMTHTTGVATSAQDWIAEINGARAALSALAGVPEEQLTGFRAPFLESSDRSFAALHAGGFLYDSSVPEGVAALSLSPEAKIWPYTLDFGSKQACWAGACTQASWPGLFEVPLWTLDDAEGNLVATMDPEATGNALVSLLQASFTAHYEGNRAPFGVFLHASWLADDPSRISALQGFFEWAAAHENVWFVTTRTALEWMKEPTPATDFDLSCQPRTGLGVERCDGADNDGDGSIDEGLVNTCAYPEGSFRTCSSCPALWPTPTLPLSVEVPIDGGAVAWEITQDWGGGFCAALQIQNDTTERAVDWRLDFDLLGAELTSGWDATYTSVGQRVTALPLSWNARLEPGETAAPRICALRTGDVAINGVTLQLEGVAEGVPGNGDQTPPSPPAAVPTLGWLVSAVLVGLLASLGARQIRGAGRALALLLTLLAPPAAELQALSPADSSTNGSATGPRWTGAAQSSVPRAGTHGNDGPGS